MGEFGARRLWRHLGCHVASHGQCAGDRAEHPRRSTRSRRPAVQSSHCIGRHRNDCRSRRLLSLREGSGFGLPTNAANNRLIGIECAWPTIRPDGTFDKGERWPDAQIISMRDVAAALTKKLGRGAERNISHKEWAGSAQGKWDPGNIDMNWFRGEVAKAMRGEFSPEPPVAPLPKPVDPPLLPKPANPRSDRILLEEIWDQLRGPGGNGWLQLGDMSLIDFLAYLGTHVADLRKQVTELRRTQTAIRSRGGGLRSAFVRRRQGGEEDAGQGSKKAAAKRAPAKSVRKAGKREGARQGGEEDGSQGAREGGEEDAGQSNEKAAVKRAPAKSVRKVARKAPAKRVRKTSAKAKKTGRSRPGAARSAAAEGLRRSS